jgi:hypothetical protein
MLSLQKPAASVQMVPWIGLVENLTVAQLVEKFHANARFIITVVTRAHHLTLYLARGIQSLHNQFLKVRFNLILPSAPVSCHCFVILRVRERLISLWLYERGADKSLAL